MMITFSYSKKFRTLSLIFLIGISILHELHAQSLTFNNTSTGASGTIQTWTVPACVDSITIEVWGAQGGNGGAGLGGLGAYMKGTFSVKSGQVLKILVGQQGTMCRIDGGGGGGTFVTDNLNNPLIIAGGGGGSSQKGVGTGGTTATCGLDGTYGGAKGGCAGNGGGAGDPSSGGGLLTNGLNNGKYPCIKANGGGKSFINGGNGGNGISCPDCSGAGAEGGFGGGGGTMGYIIGGGGGGGYSGGGGGFNNGNYGGGGGGSYNKGTKQTNISSMNAGHGKVVITYISSTPLLSTTISSVNISCYGGNNGTATVVAKGGVSPYTYKWSSGGTTVTENNLKAGVYTVTVKGSGSCLATQTATVTITEPKTISDVVSQTQKISCNAGNNGTVTVTPSGGTKPYKYLWSSGGTTTTIKNLIAGTYKVTITDSLLCTKADSITIIQPKAISDVVIQLQKINCNAEKNGSVTVTPSGGTAPYKYLWSSGETTDKITNLAAGTYKVTITDSLLCTKVDSITISEPLTLSLDTNIIDANCSNTKGTASVAVSGGTQPYTYLWSNGATTDTILNLQSSIYNVTVTDTNGCTATSGNIVITDILIPVASFSPTLKEGVAPVEVAFTNTSINAVSYLWSFGETANSTDSNPKYTYNDAGTYTVILTAYSVNGCADTASGVMKVQSEQSILWIPNVFTPNSDGVNDKFPKGDGVNDDFYAVGENITCYHLSIFNRWGELLFETEEFSATWDGTYKGKLVSDGVYIWTINYCGLEDGKEIEKELIGHVTVLK